MPEQLDERLALLEAEIELLKCKIALDPNNLIAKSDLSSCIEPTFRTSTFTTHTSHEDSTV